MRSIAYSPGVRRRSDDPSSFEVSKGMSHHAIRAIVAVAVLSFSVLGPPVQAQDNPSAQELADLRARAEAGDADAQLSLGLMSLDGFGTILCDAAGRSSDSRSHSRGRPRSPAQLDSGREGHLR